MKIMKSSKILEKGQNYTKERKFGMLTGVFTPDVLTILGVIMYLRLGWVVGNAGLFGALAIIILAKSITICTGLSMSSITTNIRIGAGGAYSIITKSLGFEAGGSIGIPFYISQSLSAALYIVGFSEGWTMIFPGHNPQIVMVLTWGVLLGVSIISTSFALKFQYYILAIIAVSILSFLLSPTNNPEPIQMIGAFEDASFWQVFAVFFPAVTGIMAGANLSGDLKNPRKDLPIGTISAILVTLLVYCGLAYFASLRIGSEELRTNQFVMVDHALIGQLVIAGILAATFSSALGSIVGAPRILQALAADKTIPFSGILSKKTATNEPRNAFILTAAIILVALFVGSLDALAALITMFFLITYGMLNAVVFIQQSIKIISFRPTFKIPRLVSFFGAVGCVFIMFLINPIFSIVAIVTIISLYFYFTKKGLQSADSGDIRGGMFLVLAETASRIAEKFPRHQITWKPDLLVPIEEPKVWGGSMLLIRNIVYQSGSLFAFSVKNKEYQETKADLDKVLLPLRRENVLVNTAVIEDNNFLHGAKIVIQTLQAGAFRPNTLFLTLGNNTENDHLIHNMVQYALDHQLGTIILRQHPRMAFGLQKTVNIWLRDKSPNWNLAILIGLQLQKNWNGKIHLITVASDESEKPRLYKFLEHLSDQARLPSMTEFHVLDGEFKTILQRAPAGDINIFGLSDQLDLERMRILQNEANSSCLFIRDAGWENALA